MITTAYIGGHAFSVQFDYTPEVKPEGDEPFEDEVLEINTIYLGDADVTQLLLEEAYILYVNVYDKVLERIKEGLEDEG